MQLTTDTEYEITMKQPTRVATLAEMTADEIQALIDFLEEEIQERDWDRQWDETLASEESKAYWAARIPEIAEERNAGETTKYVKGKRLAELFHQKV